MLLPNNLGLIWAQFGSYTAILQPKMERGQGGNTNQFDLAEGLVNCRTGNRHLFFTFHIWLNVPLTSAKSDTFYKLVKNKINQTKQNIK